MYLEVKKTGTRRRDLCYTGSYTLWSVQGGGVRRHRNGERAKKTCSCHNVRTNLAMVCSCLCYGINLEKCERCKFLEEKNVLVFRALGSPWSTRKAWSPLGLMSVKGIGRGVLGEISKEHKFSLNGIIDHDKLRR